MKNRYRMYIRGKHSGSKVWWCEDNQTGKRESLKTTDKQEARRLLDARNQPISHAGFHVQMARTHLLVSDPEAVSRTWQTVIPERFAQEALGHNSKAVHRAYAKRALVKIPSLEEYEQRAAQKDGEGA